MHVGFPDPAKAIGTEAEIMAAFRQVREALREALIIQAKRYHLLPPRLGKEQGICWLLPCIRNSPKRNP
jgi:hypothetical protein